MGVILECVILKEGGENGRKGDNKGKREQERDERKGMDNQY